MSMFNSQQNEFERAISDYTNNANSVAQGALNEMSDVGQAARSLATGGRSALASLDTSQISAKMAEEGQKFAKTMGMDITLPQTYTYVGKGLKSFGGFLQETAAESSKIRGFGFGGKSDNFFEGKQAFDVKPGSKSVKAGLQDGEKEYSGDAGGDVKTFKPSKKKSVSEDDDDTKKAEGDAEDEDEFDGFGDEEGDAEPAAGDAGGAVPEPAVADAPVAAVADAPVAAVADAPVADVLGPEPDLLPALPAGRNAVPEGGADAQQEGRAVEGDDVDDLGGDLNDPLKSIQTGGVNANAAVNDANQQAQAVSNDAEAQAEEGAEKDVSSLAEGVETETVDASASVAEDVANFVGGGLSMFGGFLGDLMPVVGVGLAGYSLYESLDDMNKAYGSEGDDPYAKVRADLSQGQGKIDAITANISADQFSSKVGGAAPSFGSLAAPTFSTAQESTGGGGHF